MMAGRMMDKRLEQQRGRVLQTVFLVVYTVLNLLLLLCLLVAGFPFMTLPSTVPKYRTTENTEVVFLSVSMSLFVLMCLFTIFVVSTDRGRQVKESE